MIILQMVIFMKYEFEFSTVLKLGDWAASLADDIDFLDYWFSLSLSSTKRDIESDFMNKINAFHWTRWKEDFEEFNDGYSMIAGEGFSSTEREWFAMYTQYLVYAFQSSSSCLAKHYGIETYRDIMANWFKYHTFGVDQFAENIATKHGLPLGVATVHKIGM